MSDRDLHLVIDARCVGRVPHGMHVFTTSIALGLESLGELPYRVTYLVSAENGEAIFASARHARSVTLDARFLNPREWVEVPTTLKRLGADLFHSPTFASFPHLPCPWISTVHDLNHLKYGGFSEKAYYRMLLKPFVKGAAQVCTVSEFARDEIARWSGVPKDEIEVTSNAIRAGEYAAERKGGASFFCLTNPKPHKNVAFLLAAYARYRALCASERVAPWILQVSVPAEGRAIEGVEFLDALSNEHVRELRRRAGAVVFPSLYEGFGLPPVEAAVEGILPLVSDIQPHREGLAGIAAEEAGWFDPRDVEACARVLLRATRGEFQRPSREHADAIRARFSIGNLGRQMDRIYRDVLRLSS